MGTYAQLNTPDGSMADISSLDNKKFADVEKSGFPSDDDIEEDSATKVEEEDKVIVVEDDDCLGWHGMMGQWPLVTCFWFILAGGGIGVAFSLLIICAQYVFFAATSSWGYQYLCFTCLYFRYSTSFTLLLEKTATKKRGGVIIIR